MEHEQAAARWRAEAEAGDAQAMNRLGVVLAMTGDLDAAEAWLRRAMASGVDGARYNLARVLEQRGEHEAALDEYRLVVEEHGDMWAINSMGNLLYERGEQREAEACWRWAADLGDANAMNSLALLLDARGETAAADERRRRAADAGHPEAMYSLGYTAYQQDRPDEAEQWWQRAAESGLPKASNALGSLSEDRGDLQRAEQFYRSAAEAGNDVAAQNLARLRPDG
jgi:TPR repeat protein